MDLKLKPTTPLFLGEAEILNGELKKLSLAEVQKLMHISENLAKETKLKVANWSKVEAWPAWLLFVGDVYKGLNVVEFDEEDFEFANGTMATLSGLYGIVRPLDLIKPYRLEAGFKLKVGTKKNLYEFWGDKIAGVFGDENEVLNLSSEEYIKLVRHFFGGKIITPKFIQKRSDGTKFEAVHAKFARGKMASWIVKNRIVESAKLKDFRELGYRFDAKLSSELEPVFTREVEGVVKLK